MAHCTLNLQDYKYNDPPEMVQYLNVYNVQLDVKHIIKNFAICNNIIEM